jgi:GAF domain-containing protein/DNA-binding response OmpR family regulator
MSKKIFCFSAGKFFLCLTILLFSASRLLAQDAAEKGLPFITNYLPKNYKALPQTWCVMENNQGIMYFGIQNGVLEYDGVKWRKVKFEKIPPVVRALDKDKHGKIYYGAIGDLGYFEHDSLGQTVAKSLLHLIPKEFRNFYDVWTIHVASEGIYFQSREYIFRINDNNVVQTWKPNSKFMYSFYLDDNYYVHEQGLGLYKMIKDSLQFIKGSEFLGKERMQVMLPYKLPGSPLSEKKYLVGLFYSGLYVFDGNKFEPFKSEATPILTSGTLYKGVETKDGYYALSTTGKGLVLIDANGKLIKQINRDVGLQDESVYAVFADSKGMLWLALDNGISRVETATPLTQFTNQAGINTATLSIERLDGDLYLGTTNGLMVFDKKNSRFNAITQIPPNQTFSLLKDGNSLLVASDGLFAVENKKVKLIKQSIGGNLQITGLLLSKIYPTLYAGSPFGVEVFGRTSDGWKSYGLVPGLEDQIWTFSENPDGSLWVGTQNNTFYKLTAPKFNSDDELIMNEFKIERFGEETGLKDILGSVFKIKGETYFPADSCIYKYDQAQKKFVKEESFGNFPNGGGKEEFFITEDKSGRVWIRFGKETVLAIPQPNGKYRIDKTSLLPIGDRSVSAIYPEDNGIVWICTTDGLVRFDERVQKNYDAPFNTILRHISAGSTVINPHTYDSIYKPPSITYNNSSLRFEYAAPFFEQEDKTQYQTWLEGFEETWSGWDNNYYKEYTNLPEGDYKFHVRSMNVYHKPGKEAVFSFTILPPWWRTWWAYTIYALLAVGLIYSLIRWRTKQLHEKHKELERVVEERTYELSHRLKELAVINSVQDGLVREMDMDSIYEMVGEKIREIFKAQVIDIVTYDKVTNLMEDKYAYEKGDRTLVGKWEPEGFRKHVIETGEVLCINKNLESKAEEFNSKVIHGELPKSAIWVPLITGNEVKGMISLQDIDKENAFAESDIRLLTTLGNSMSVALESVRRFDETNRLLKETEQRNAELAVINSVQESLVAQLDIKSIYELVGEKIRNIFDAQVIDIVTYDPTKNLIEDQYSYEKGDRSMLGPRIPKGFRKHVIETGEILLTNNNVEQAMIDFDNQILIGDMPKSQVYVPMIAGGRVKGIISLQNLDHEHAFSESNVNLLSTLANSMSVALESARLFDETNRLLKETEQRNAELAVINSVQESLVAQMDIKSIYELVGEKIRNIFDAQVIDIVTYNSLSNIIEDQYAYEKGDRTLLGPREPKGFRKHVIETGEVLLTNENVEQAMIDFDNQVLIGDIPKSQIYVPMIAGGKVKGIISLQNLDHENAFPESNVSLLITLANSMSVALESARLFDETTRLLKETGQRNAELAVITSVQESLVAQMDMQGIYDLVGEKMREIFNAQVIDIVTYDKNTGLIEDRYAFEKGDRTLVGKREPKGFRKHVIKEGQLLVINKDVEELRLTYDNTVIVGEASKSLVMVPMVVGGEVTGVISLQNIDQENAFSDSDINLLNTLVNSMSVALKSARLFDETVRLLKETEQRTAELAVINSVQEGLAKELDMQGIYNLVGDRVQTLFKAQAVIIATFDAQYKFENFNYVFENNERVKISSREINYLRRKLINDKQTIYIKTERQASEEYGITAIEDTEMPKCLLFVPLVAGTDVRGYVSLQNIDQENAFSDSDVRLLETLANSMSVALENARLFDETNRLLKETEQRTAELAVINSVQEGLVREMDMQAIYELVGNRLCNLFPDTQTLVIRTFDHVSGNEQWQYAIEKGVRLYSKPRPFNWANQRLINTMQPMHINKDYVETAKKFGGTGVTKGTPPKSAVFVPMIVGDVVKGSVSLQNIDIENAFTESDVRLLTTLTNSMSVALENARLFDETHRLLKETEQRTAELAVINSVQEGLVKEIDMQAIYETVGDRLCTLFNIQTVVIRTFDHESGLETWRYAIEKGEKLYSDPRPFNWANKQLISSRRPLIINRDYVETAKKFGGAGVTKGQPPKSAVFVPMVVGDVVKGSVSLQNVDIENAFSEADIRLLTTLTNSMSVALENARLFDETTRLLGEAKQRASELSTVNNISKAIASQLNPNDLIQLVGEQLRDLFNANIVYLALLDQKTQTIYFPYQFGDELKPMKLGEGLTSQIILTGDSLLINRNIQEFRKQLGVSMLGIPAASYLGVPIPVGDEHIGVLSVQSTEQENRFNENDKRLLSTIAASVGVALRNAKLFEDVQLAKNEAEAASKAAEKANEAKSAFLSTVSHELRTPLTSVLGFTKIIRKRLDEKIFPVVNQDDPKTGKVINQINENLNVVIAEGERLTHLINDVLDLAKIEAGKMEWNMEDVSMTEVAERAIAATSSLFETKPLKLKKHIDDNLPKISGDRDKLIQVIINLISNSVKFTDSGTVSCNIYQKDKELIVEIEDTGIGIAKEDFDAVFEQFKQVGGDTLTDKPKGTGLGLPICKEIIEHHGGRIWLESKVGEGSKFSFALPVVKEESGQPLHLNQLIKQLKEQMNHSSFKVIGSNSTILVVDDDDSIRSLLNQELTEAGYNIEEAANGKEALEKIRKNRPDLIILDVMMPEMNGFDVAAILKNDPSTMDIPIIVLSIVQDKARGFRIGVDRYLTKPINTAELFTEVGSLLDQGKSKRKVLVVDEDSTAVRSLSDVLEAKGYNVVESDGTHIVQQAINTQPDIIILNSVKTGRQELMKTIRFEKGLENVLFLMYQ